jgi:hypothetical protein
MVLYKGKNSILYVKNFSKFSISGIHEFNSVKPTTNVLKLYSGRKTGEITVSKPLSTHQLESNRKKPESGESHAQKAKNGRVESLKN